MDLLSDIEKMEHSRKIRQRRRCWANDNDWHGDGNEMTKTKGILTTTVHDGNIVLLLLLLALFLLLLLHMYSFLCM